MSVFYLKKCDYCGFVYLDWYRHTDNECNRRLKLQLERMREGVKK